MSLASANGPARRRIAASTLYQEFCPVSVRRGQRPRSVRILRAAHRPRPAGQRAQDRLCRADPRVLATDLENPGDRQTSLLRPAAPARLSPRTQPQAGQAHQGRRSQRPRRRALSHDPGRILRRPGARSSVLSDALARRARGQSTTSGGAPARLLPAEPRPAFPFFPPRSITMFKPLVRWRDNVAPIQSTWPRWRSVSWAHFSPGRYSGRRPAASAPPAPARGGSSSSPCSPIRKYTSLERGALLSVLAIAIIGLLYALMLAKQVKAADAGTKRMQDIAAAVREGADAYLAAQFKRILPLIFIITVVLYFTTQSDLSAFQVRPRRRVRRRRRV